jgi:hypothetical protein
MNCHLQEVRAMNKQNHFQHALRHSAIAMGPYWEQAQ